MDRAGVIVSEMGEFSKVKLVRHTACGNCGACQLGDDQKDIMLIAKNTVHAKMGDLVEVSMATNSVLIFPGKDVMTAFLGIGAMALSFVMIKLNDKRFLKNDKYVAHILTVLQSEHEGMVPLT